MWKWNGKKKYTTYNSTQTWNTYWQLEQNNINNNSHVQWNLQNAAEGKREGLNERRCTPFLRIRGLYVVKMSILKRKKKKSILTKTDI